MYVPVLGFLLINRALAGLPTKLVEEIVLNGIIYIGWNAIKITYQGITYSISSAYNYSTSSAGPDSTIPLLEYKPASNTDDSCIEEFIEITSESIKTYK
jgi:hypothetical protein